MRCMSWQGRMASGLVAAGVAAGVAGCKADPVALDDTVRFDVPRHAAPAANATTAGPASGGASASLAAAAQPAGFDDMPTPPAGARFTIYCQSYSGRDHQDVARHVRDLLQANTPYHKWYVVHGEAQSTLYYGFYATVGRDADNPKEGERSLADLTAIRTLRDSRGTRLFASSLPVPITSPDPAANPAWDITRSGGYWSLEIGTFKDTPDRKERAVEAVAEARKAGYPAYYYHGYHASSVCIGAWPAAAASELTASQQNTDPNSLLLVTPRPLSKPFQDQIGSNVQALAPHVEPVDPDMVQMIARFPDHAVNGMTMMRRGPDGKATNVPAERAFLFKIQEAVAAGGRHGTVGQPPEDDTVFNAPSAPGGGLRKLDN